MKIVITDFINISGSGRDELEKISDIKIFDDVVNDPDIIIDRIKNAEIVTANFIDLTEEIIRKSPKLKYIISPAKGYDWIDSKTASELGIKILNCPTFNAQAVAEHALTLMFAVAKKLLPINSQLLDGKYDTQNLVGSEIAGKKMVTVGHGEIGKRILKMAEGLGMVTDYLDSKSNNLDFENKLRTADVLVLCLPLNENTNGLIDLEKLKLLKSTCIFINVARGLIVDQSSLYLLLKENKLAGAGIDTFAKDETIKSPTEEILNFSKLPNVVATPHIAYNTQEAADRLGKELLQDIHSCLENKPVNVVN